MREMYNTHTELIPTSCCCGDDKADEYDSCPLGVFFKASTTSTRDAIFPDRLIDRARGVS